MLLSVRMTDYTKSYKQAVQGCSKPLMVDSCTREKTYNLHSTAMRSGEDGMAWVLELTGHRVPNAMNRSGPSSCSSTWTGTAPWCEGLSVAVPSTKNTDIRASPKSTGDSSENSQWSGMKPQPYHIRQALVVGGMHALRRQMSDLVILSPHRCVKYLVVQRF